MNLHYMNRKMVLNGLCKFRALLYNFIQPSKEDFILSPYLIIDIYNLLSFSAILSCFLQFLEIRVLYHIYIIFWNSLTYYKNETFKFVLSGKLLNIIWWAWKFIVLCHNVLERKKGNWWEEVCWDYQCMNLNFYFSNVVQTTLP